MLPKWVLSPKRRSFRVLGAVGAGLAAGVLASAATAAPAVAGSVRVTKGETLGSIAAQYHTTVASLAAANAITNPNLLLAGTVLQVPGSPSGGSVTVRRGQTLEQIAAQYGTSVGALAAANDITNLNLVYAGQVLVLPAGGSAPAPSASSVTTVTVRTGDTLSAIASRYHTTVVALASLNSIGDANDIYAGEHLDVPVGAMQLASYSGAPGGKGSLPAQLLAHPSRLALRPDFVASAETYGVPASLVEALCWWESGWQDSVVSSTGAIGVCQIEPATGSFVNGVLYPGRDLDIYSAAGNIAISAAYLHDLLVRTGGNESLAVAGYYQGLPSVQRSGMLPTTRNYVKGILAYASIFEAAF